MLVLARSTDPATGHSLLADRRTTCLPKYLERSAYVATAWRLGRYYRTYPAYVEDEVRLNLDDPTQFERGPRTFRRGTATDDRHAFVVEDGAYLSARWPGDAYLFARRFAALSGYHFVILPLQELVEELRGHGMALEEQLLVGVEPGGEPVHVRGR